MDCSSASEPAADMRRTCIVLWVIRCAVQGELQADDGVILQHFDGYASVLRSTCTTLSGVHNLIEVDSWNRVLRPDQRTNSAPIHRWPQRAYLQTAVTGTQTHYSRTNIDGCRLDIGRVWSAVAMCITRRVFS
jgi:hypothetical protein